MGRALLGGYMIRVLAQYLSLETAALGVFEFALSFVLILTALAVSDAGAWADGRFAPANLAVCLALVAAGSTALVGLYRPEFCRDRRNMFAKIAVAGAAAVALVLLIISGLQVVPSRSSALWVAGMLVVWVGCIVLTRLAFAAMVQRGLLARRVLIWGAGPRADRVAALLRTRYGARFEPVTLAADERAPSPDALRQQRVWGVVIAAETLDDDCAQALLDSKLRGIRILRDSGFVEQQLGRIDLDTVDSGVVARGRGICCRAGHRRRQARHRRTGQPRPAVSDLALDGADSPADQTG